MGKSTISMAIYHAFFMGKSINFIGKITMVWSWIIQEDLPTYWVDMCSGDHAKGMSLEECRYDRPMCAERGEWIQLLHWSSPKFERISQVHHNESPDHDVYFAMKESQTRFAQDVNLIKNPERNTGYNGSHIWQATLRAHDMSWYKHTWHITSSSGCLLFHFIYVVLKRDSWKYWLERSLLQSSATITNYITSHQPGLFSPIAVAWAVIISRNVSENAPWPTWRRTGVATEAMYDENCFEVGSSMPRGRFASDASMCYEEINPEILCEPFAPGILVPMTDPAGAGILMLTWLFPVLECVLWYSICFFRFFPRIIVWGSCFSALHSTAFLSSLLLSVITQFQIPTKNTLSHTTLSRTTLSHTRQNWIF